MVEAIRAEPELAHLLLRRRRAAQRRWLLRSISSLSLILFGALLHSAVTFHMPLPQPSAALKPSLLAWQRRIDSPDTSLTEPAGWISAVRRWALGMWTGDAWRDEEKPQPLVWPAEFWDYRSTHFAQATALYVGIRVLPRCTIALLALTKPELLLQLGVDLGSYTTWFLWLAVPYVELFLLVVPYAAAYPYTAFLAGWLAFARTKWEIEWACVLSNYIAAQLVHGERGRLVDDGYGWWAPFVKAVLLPTSILFNCVVDTVRKFTSLNSLTLHALLLLLCSRRVCELVFFFYHQIDPIFEVLAFVLSCLPQPDPVDRARALDRMRGIARPWANRMVVFLAGGQGRHGQGARMPQNLPPPPTYWPTPLSIGEGVDELEDVPHDFRCGISMSLMRLPASTPTGETFDYEPLCTWIALKGTHPTDPLRPLSVDQLHPNLYLRNQIECWLESRVSAHADEGERGARGETGARPLSSAADEQYVAPSRPHELGGAVQSQVAVCVGEPVQGEHAGRGRSTAASNRRAQGVSAGRPAHAQSVELTRVRRARSPAPRRR